MIQFVFSQPNCSPPIKSKVPKAVISMKDLNAEFQPEKIGHAHGLQISFKEDEHTRNLFVYHEDGQVRPTHHMESTSEHAEMLVLFLLKIMTIL